MSIYRSNKVSDPKKNIIMDEKIENEKIMLLNSDHSLIGEMTKAQALKLASESNSNVIKVDEKDMNSTAVCLLMPVNKFLYILNKKTPKKTVSNIKCFQLYDNIQTHDVLYRLKRIEEAILEDGYSVQLVLRRSRYSQLSSQDRKIKLEDMIAILPNNKINSHISEGNRGEVIAVLSRRK